jgi:hypothetical protein
VNRVRLRRDAIVLLILLIPLYKKKNITDRPRQATTRKNNSKTNAASFAYGHWNLY